MAAMYDGDNNRVFELDNTYKWEDCYGDEVLIPENQRTEDGDSPKEQLASLVKGGSNAKGYTLTEYINDINRENTEVLAEYGSDEKVRQAYTYGESGIGERISVDKSTESSYYLYDGRNSVTEILTETANLTNSYQYDPYGNLTSGTADGVNYYGYNGESTNVKTGLQYLRARYYNAENGTFTTEDSDLGTTENPLTRNRYDYTTNNPLNYSDPTGHSLWSRIKSTAKKAAKAVKSVGKKIVNTAKKVVKTVVNTAKKAAKTIVNAVKGVAKTAKNAAKHAKQTYKSVKNRVTSSSTYQKITSRGSQFIRSVSNGVHKIGKTYTSFKSYVSERTAEIRSEVVRHMCTTTNRITDKLGKVDWKKVGIAVVATGAAVGIGILTGGVGTLAIGALGLTEGTLGAAIVGGAVTGAIGGATYSGVSSGLSGNSLKQVAKDTLTGGLMGALTGGAMGGLAYGAGKAVGAVKNIIKGSNSTTKPGHISEIAKKNLSDIGNKSEPQLDLENGDVYELLKKHGITPTLSDEERATADAYGLVAKKTTDTATTNSVKETQSKEFLEWLNKGNADNKVYFGEKDGKALYTGITKQSTQARLRQHQNSGKELDQLVPQFSDLTRNQARSIEQYYIENGPNELNKINSISQKNKHYHASQEWAKQYIKSNQ